MKKIKKRDLTKLFNNLCCSKCKSDFDENSIEILRNEDDELMAVKLICNNCGKSFGVAFMGLEKGNFKNFDINDIALEINKNDAPISEKDVIEAGKFIQSLNADWQKYI